MQRLKSITIENFRSIGDRPVQINFATKSPTIIIGENNSGKSNVIRSIELLFGEFHPKYKRLDNFDHFQRNEHNAIRLQAEVTGFNGRLGRNGEFSCSGFEYECVKGKDSSFCAIQSEDGNPNPFVSNGLREELVCVVVNAEQNLNYQLSYSSKFTLLSKVTKMFHENLVNNEDRLERLKIIFAEIKSVFLEVDEFSDFNSNMSAIAGQMLTNMDHALQFDFSAYDPSNYFKTLRVQPSENGDTRSIDELGTGQQQILALAFAHAYAKAFLRQGLIFILDEPEAHLHPLAQKWLAKQMYKMADDGLQLIIITHSPYFINVEYLNSIYLVKKGDQTTVTNVTAEKLTNFCKATGAPKAVETKILPFYSAHSKPHILNGFFAKKIILVEGETEELALPIYLEHVGLDTLKESIAIIGVGGKGNLAKWWRLFTCFELPTYICFDNDGNDDKTGSKRIEALKTIGFDDEHEVKALLTSEEWNIGEKYCVFGKDFESTMIKSFSAYEDLQKRATEYFGGSKPIIARALANRICGSAISADDIGWSCFFDLREKIEELKS